MVQVVPLSLSVRPCKLIICRAFFLSVDDFVDEFTDTNTPILIGLVIIEADSCIFAYFEISSHKMSRQELLN
jgi:hypothetical protein